MLLGFRLQIIQLVFQLLFLNETLESHNHTTPGDEDFKGRVMVEKSLTPAGNQLNLVFADLFLKVNHHLMVSRRVSALTEALHTHQAF